MDKHKKHIFVIVLFVLAFVAILYSSDKNMFPHNIHKENDIECKTCHIKANTSTSASDSNIPDNAVCTEECHENDIFDSVKYLKSTPKYELEFNHEVHIELDLDCQKCHKGINTSKFAPGSAFPKMSLCFECHDNDTAPKKCTLCHIQKVPFPHDTHLDNDVECEDCHKKILASTKMDRGKDIPSGKICSLECHDKNDGYSDVTVFDALETAPTLKVEFNHELHIEQEVKCLKCHKNIKKRKLKPGEAFPNMDICFECHDNDAAPKTCSLCHTEKIQFPHKLHLENDLECDECHKKIKESTKTDDGKDIPDEKNCNECHDKTIKYGSVVLFPYVQAYKFNHKYHIEEYDQSCKDCHDALYKSNSVKQSELVPKMDYCFECHDNSTATQYCMLCHINPTEPDDHKTNWNNLHKVKSNENLKDCIDCHESKSFCLKCHKGVVKPAIHNPNFELTHKFEARTRLQNCKACHTERQCQNCHISKGVNRKASVYKKVHPAGWENITSPNFHKRRARFRLRACTACHKKNDCWGCHNPNFIGPRKGR